MKYLQIGALLGLMLLAGCSPDRSMKCSPVATSIIGKTNIEQLCGLPYHIVYSMDATGLLHEQWVYRSHFNDRSGYIYLDDKVVTGWQVP